jgi:hypothetical protein
MMVMMAPSTFAERFAVIGMASLFMQDAQQPVLLMLRDNGKALAATQHQLASLLYTAYSHLRGVCQW